MPAIIYLVAVYHGMNGMEIQTLQYLEGKGWSSPRFPPLDSKNTLIFVFAAPEFYLNSEPIRELSQFYTNSAMIGCSSSGEILDGAIYDHSLSVLIVKFAKTTIQLAKATVESVHHSYQAGQQLRDSLESPDLQSMFVLSDGLHVNGSELVKGLNHQSLKQILITGGLAGDGNDFKLTWTIFNGQILTNQVVAVGFYGHSIYLGHASKGGWDIFGPVRRVTRSRGNILYELDNKPVLELYKEYLGTKAQELPSSGLLFPLAISNPEDVDPAQLVRTILGIDEKHQALIFAGDIPMGYNARLMRANFDRIIHSASEAGSLASQRMLEKADCHEANPVVVLAISCVGRRLLLGERTEEEVESCLENMPKGAIQVGFYSYGELSPFALGNCELHNQTMTLTTFFEC